MYRALITDLDGTAVAISSDGREIDEETREAVRQAQRRGFKLSCATGREWALAQPVIERLGIVSPCIIEGGTRIVEPDTGTPLWEKYMETGAPQAALRIFKSEVKEMQKDDKPAENAPAPADAQQRELPSADTAAPGTSNADVKKTA